MDAHMMAKNPKKTWDEMKEHKEEVIGTFTEENMLEYVENLYNLPRAQQMQEPTLASVHDNDCFSEENAKKAIQHMNNGKAGDSNGLYAEMLKWLPEEGINYIVDIINQVHHNGFPPDWQDNWIKAIHKGGNINDLSNYRTIMVGPIMAKLFGCMMDRKISTWAEKNAKRAKGQAGFRAKHNTIDHLITLRVIMEESKRLGKSLLMCFVEFGITFNTVPREGLFKRMQYIGVPKYLKKDNQLGSTPSSFYSTQ